jgi:hypothetical protein
MARISLGATHARNFFALHTELSASNIYIEDHPLERPPQYAFRNLHRPLRLDRRSLRSKRSMGTMYVGGCFQDIVTDANG